MLKIFTIFIIIISAHANPCSDDGMLNILSSDSEILLTEKVKNKLNIKFIQIKSNIKSLLRKFEDYRFKDTEIIELMNIYVKDYNNLSISDFYNHLSQLSIVLGDFRNQENNNTNYPNFAGEFGNILYNPQIGIYWVLCSFNIIIDNKFFKEYNFIHLVGYPNSVLDYFKYLSLLNLERLLNNF